MNEIFTNLYNKVLGFFRQAEKEEESAKDVACNRLRVVLMQDRTNLTPELMERMRKELVELLSKYVEMDKEALELNLEQDGEQVALMLSIPVIRAKDEEEINAALEENDKETKETSDDDEEEKLEDIESEDENISEDEASEEGTDEEQIAEENLNAEEDEAVEETEEDTSKKNNKKEPLK